MEPHLLRRDAYLLKPTSSIFLNECKRNHTFPAHARDRFGVEGPATEECSVTEPALGERPDKRFFKDSRKKNKSTQQLVASLPRRTCTYTRHTQDIFFKDAKDIQQNSLPAQSAAGGVCGTGGRPAGATDAGRRTL